VAGYSGTPLAKKLGIRAGARLFLHAPPGNYPQPVARKAARAAPGSRRRA
jgi:hypothetical protein